MEFIPPLEISSRIMTLIEDSEKEIILVSPYVSISGWIKMKKCLERAVKRGVKIVFFARKNAKQDLSFIEQIGINLILVQDLHAKLYLNENYGIITSQNISQYSDENSIDIGYRTESIDEKQELLKFIKKYIGISEIKIEEASPLQNIAQNDIQKVALTKLELDFLSSALRKKFKNCKLTQTSSYIFNDTILWFGDLMIDSELTIKIAKDRPGIQYLLSMLEDIISNDRVNFTLRIRNSHKSFYYLTVVNNTKTDYEKIVSEFIVIINDIISSELL